MTTIGSTRHIFFLIGAGSHEALAIYFRVDLGAGGSVDLDHFTLGSFTIFFPDGHSETATICKCMGLIFIEWQVKLSIVVKMISSM